ncbi:MAG: glycosyltransferase family 4 protein [Chloroflexi bacterium]|nr:MAG: glycosyltransferase family 4 protein [Chloroflexota bacterium]
MRVALVAPLVTAIAQPYLGGAQALLADLAQGLIQRGHTVTLFARDDSFVPGIAIEPVNVPDNVLPADFSQPLQERDADPAFFTQANLFLELFLKLRQRSAEFDLVHIHAFDWPAFACSTLIQDIPVIHTLHLPAVTPEINEALRVMDRQGHPQTLVTVSYSCAETYASYTLIDYVIYNGLDLDAIPFNPKTPVEAPLLFAGRIAPEKGVEAAIVTYLGQLERLALWKVMGQSLGLLFPIEWDEPFGLTAVEAMATGTPVIAFRRGAAQEIIRHGETGFLVEEGETAHAAALVDDLYDIPRAHCRAHVEANFSLQQMLDTYEQVYYSLSS